MPISDKSRRVEMDHVDSVFDAGFILRASRLHMNPTHPEVAKLIEEELKWATDIIANLQGLQLLVGRASIEAYRHNNDRQPTVASIMPGTQLAIEGVEDHRIVTLTGKRELHIMPDILAGTLIDGGEIFLPKRASPNR